MGKLGRPPKYATARQLQKIINAYFAECDPHWVDEEYWDYPFIEVEESLEPQAHGGALKRAKVRDRDAEMTLQVRKTWTQQEPYTMSGLARRIGLSRQALMEYKKDRGDEFGDTIKAARSIVEEFNERLLLSGKYATGAIFNLKVNFGFKEHEEENPPPENPIIFINNVPVPKEDEQD
jgi:transcriptional regulator with XRE-family HTH domain